MAENWDAVAAEVADAISDVGFVATLTRRTNVGGTAWKPASFTTVDYNVVVIDDQIRIRNQDGSLTGQSQRVLTMSALGSTTPQKDDMILVRGTTHVVLDVLPTAPGGVDLLFDVVIGGPNGATS